MTILLASIFISSFMIALSGAVMPGPLLTVTISESVRQGIKTGPLMIFGHGLLELLLIVGLLAGLAPLLSNPLVFIFISASGGMVLFWMGMSMLRSLPVLMLPSKKDQGGRKNLIFTGALLSLVNPYWIIWWATIGLGYLMKTMEYGIAAISVFFIGHILADLSWYVLISFGIVRGKRFFTDTTYRALVGFCAVFLLVFSGYFFYSAIDKLLNA